MVMSEKMRFYTNFNLPPKRSITFSKDDELSVSMTKQSFAAECDINRIVDKFPVIDYESAIDAMPKELFGHIVSADEMSGAIKTVNLVNEQMMSLPAKVRDLFGNDPVRFLQYLEQPGAVEKLQKDGYFPSLSVSNTEGATASSFSSDEGNNDSTVSAVEPTA